jgi:hypothetical protein
MRQTCVEPVPKINLCLRVSIEADQAFREKASRLRKNLSALFEEMALADKSDQPNSNPYGLDMT